MVTLPDDPDAPAPPADPQVRFTTEVRASFLHYYEHTGDIRYSSRLAGVSHSTIHRVRRADEVFAAQMAEAKAVYETRQKYHKDEVVHHLDPGYGLPAKLLNDPPPVLKALSPNERQDWYSAFTERVALLDEEIRLCTVREVRLLNWIEEVKGTKKIGDLGLSSRETKFGSDDSYTKEKEEPIVGTVLKLESELTSVQNQKSKLIRLRMDAECGRLALARAIANAAQGGRGATLGLEVQRGTATGEAAEASDIYRFFMSKGDDGLAMLDSLAQLVGGGDTE
jgi:hypothetical protein